MEPEKTGTAIVNERQRAEQVYREALYKTEIRKWCIEKMVQVACSPLGINDYDEFLNDIYNFLTNKEKTNDKAS